MTDTANPSPDWYPDPTGRFEQRYWDGSQWTEHVSSAGQQRSDPLAGSAPADAAASDLPGLGDFADLSTGMAPASAGVPDPFTPAETTPSPEPPVSDPPVEPTASVVAGFAAVAPVPEPTPTPTVPAPAAEWYPDPTGRYEQRYWDGADWTEHVTAAGQQGIDPLPDTGPGDLTSGAEANESIDADADADAGSGSAASVVPNPFASSIEPEAEQPAEPVMPATDEATDVVPEEAETVIDPVAAGPDATQPSATQPVVNPSDGPAADWYPDPSGRYEQRYWDGTQWTEHASSAGQPVVDPLG